MLKEANDNSAMDHIRDQIEVLKSRLPANSDNRNLEHIVCGEAKKFNSEEDMQAYFIKRGWTVNRKTKQGAERDKF